jgi:CHAT domain-containing protein
MAELYESEGRNGEALDLARRAIAQAERGGGPDVVARWSAQAGRLLVATGDLEGAITAWSRAVAARRGSRSATSVSYTGDAASSATTDWPMYLGLVDALLRRSATADGDAAQALLARARDTLELLKADELRDYFRDECVDAQRARLTRVAEASASALVVYPIALPDRLEILVQGRSRGLEHRSVPVGAKALRAEIRSLRRLLERRTTREYLRPAQRLYDWLVRPLAPDLASDEVDTLVFVPDAALRTIPVASLHDGERFLVERFALAITPGLELTDPRPLDRGDLRPLVAGLSEPGGGLAPLPHIDAEVRAVHASIGGTLLVGDAFRREALHASLAGRAFNVVHIATHGEVLADARQSFLVASDGRIGMDELAADVGLARFRETPLELLTLSACETAEGDERAALGLSGIAVQAGARSVLGTLWNVNDAASAALMGELYRALLTPGTSRAAALQRAQQKLIADPRWRHPAYWSGFLLIGSWL